MEHEGGADINCNWRARNNLQMIDKGTGGLRNQRTNGDHLDYSIIKIGQNTEKGPGDLRRFAANTDVKNSRGVIIIIIIMAHPISARGPDLIIINNKKKRT